MSESRPETTEDVWAIANEHSRKVSEILEFWQHGNGRSIPRRVAAGVSPILGDIKEMDALHTLKANIDKLTDAADQARYSLNEIGGEMAGIAEQSIRAGGPRNVRLPAGASVL